MSHFDQFSRCQWSLIIIVLVVWLLFYLFFSLWYRAFHAVSTRYKCICISTSKYLIYFHFDMFDLVYFISTFFFSLVSLVHGFFICLNIACIPSIRCALCVPFRLRNFYFDFVFIIIPNKSSQYANKNSVWLHSNCFDSTVSLHQMKYFFFV